MVCTDTGLTPLRPMDRIVVAWMLIHMRIIQTVISITYSRWPGPKEAKSGP